MTERSTHFIERKAADEGPSRRQERAYRILDAAAELIQRWGYKKTAVDDIARLAGVAKGTIYLHWKTREDLFVTLLLRESLEALQDIIARIDSDPTGIGLSSVVKHSIAVIMARPLSRALFIQDVSMLGELIHLGNEDLDSLSQQKLVAGRQLVDFFRAKGVLRTDQDAEQQLKMYATMVMGAIVVDQYLPPDMHSTPEEAAERLAAMIHATMEPASPVAPEVQSEIRLVWNQFVQGIIQMVQERLHNEII